jgi:hypothetical protein
MVRKHGSKWGGSRRGSGRTPISEKEKKLSGMVTHPHTATSRHDAPFDWGPINRKMAEERARPYQICFYYFYKIIPGESVGDWNHCPERDTDLYRDMHYYNDPDGWEKDLEKLRTHRNPIYAGDAINEVTMQPWIVDIKKWKLLFHPDQDIQSYFREAESTFVKKHRDLSPQELRALGLS